MSEESGYLDRGAADRDTDDRHLLDFARVLYRRRWPALTVFTLVCVVAVVSITSGPAVFEARTQLMIESELPEVASFKNLEQQPPGYVDESFLETQFKILQSRALARRTLESLKLWNTPPFGGQAPPVPTWSPRRLLSGAVAMVRSAGSSLAGMLGLGGDKPAAQTQAAPDESVAQARAVDALIAGLTVTPVRNSRLVDVKFRALDPALAARVVNGLATQFIQQTLELRYTTSREAGDWLTTQLAEQRKKVEASEQAVQQYRESTNAVSLEERQNIVVQKLADLNSAVTKVKTERIQKQSLYDQVQAMESNPAAFESLPSILGNSYIQKLKEEERDLQRQQAQLSSKLGEKHPEMLKINSALETVEARLSGEIRKIVDGIRNDYRAALSQEQSLNRALEEQKAEAMVLNRQAVDYGILQREAEANRKLFDQLQEQTQVTGVSSEMRSTNVRVVDEAEPPRRPMAPTGANWLVVLLAATLAATGVAAFLEYLDNRVKLPEEIQNTLGIPFLGILPSLDVGKNDAAPLVNNGAPSAFVEAVRMVRTNVIFASAEPGSQSLLVTSATPGEGKSLLASNLAIALAQAGQKVLLIDADMRRPRQHGIFDLPQEPGLSDLLVGRATSADVIRKQEQAGLSVLPAGHHAPDPTELLSSARMKQLMASAMQEFNWVLVDSPPVLAVADASILAHMTSSTIFVVGAEMTNRQAAKRSVDQLLSANARVSGGVLNRVNVNRHAYYYSHYYGKGYGQYYTAATPAASAARTRRPASSLKL